MHGEGALKCGREVNHTTWYIDSMKVVITWGFTRTVDNAASGQPWREHGPEGVKPHKVRYYLEQRDPEFAEKIAEVLCVYRQVKISRRRRSLRKRSPAMRDFEPDPGAEGP
jgi:hypothetical protein